MRKHEGGSKGADDLDRGRAKTTIVIVAEDERRIKSCRMAILRAGYGLRIVSRGEALRSVKRTHATLVLADTRLHTATRSFVCKVSLGHEIPVVFLAGGNRDDAEKAFRSGGSDCIMDPTNESEIFIRVLAALRHHPETWTEQRGERIELGSLMIDGIDGSVRMGAEEVALTPTQFGVLWELASQAGKVVRHGQLMRRVWEKPAKPGRETLRQMVRTIRGKLGDDARNPRYIITVPRVGYMMHTGGAAGSKTGPW